MRHRYSFMGSALTLKLKPRVAAAYNRAQDELADAQRRHLLLHGSPWNPLTESLSLCWTKAESAAYNYVGGLVNEQLAAGVIVMEADCTSDHLIRL